MSKAYNKALRLKDLEPSIPCNEDCGDCDFGEQLKEFSPRTFIGSDPEFNIINTNTGNISEFRGFFHGVGENGYPCQNNESCADQEGSCDPDDWCPARRNDIRNQYEEIGLDGNGTLGEIRPSHAECPIKHASNTHNLITEVEEIISEFGDQYRVIAGPYPKEAAGGHIHFSSVSRDNFKASKPMWRNSLAYYVGSPLDFLYSMRKSEQRIIDDGYGNFAHDTIRIPNDHRGLEFRMPASWMLNHSFMELVLSLTKVVVCSIENDTPKYSKHFGRKLSSDYNQVKRSPYQLASAISAIGTIRTMDLFPLFEKRINLFANMIMNGMQWNEKPYSFEISRPFEQNKQQFDLVQSVLAQGVDKVIESFPASVVSIIVTGMPNSEQIHHNLKTDIDFAHICDEIELDKLILYSLRQEQGRLIHCSWKLSQYQSSDLEGAVHDSHGGWRCISSYKSGFPSEGEFYMGIPKYISDEFSIAALCQLISEIIRVNKNNTRSRHRGCPECGETWERSMSLYYNSSEHNENVCPNCDENLRQINGVRYV